MFLQASLLSLRSALLLCTLFLGHASAHMEMSQPFPIRSRLDPSNGGNVDYNLKSPLSADGSNYPCHGYQNDRPIKTTATYSAGQSYTMSIVGEATHGGGSCQLSLSYDNGATFKVIKSMIGGCPLTTSYPFTIPSSAAAGDALLAWTWFNHIGNREMYMNCAWVQIKGAQSKRMRRRASALDSLPNIFRANIAGLNTCATVEGVDPVFANPGTDVVYADGRTASDAANFPSGMCDGSTPFGSTYLASNDMSSPGVVAPSNVSVASFAARPASSPSAAGSVPQGAFASGSSSTRFVSFADHPINIFLTKVCASQ